MKKSTEKPKNDASRFFAESSISNEEILVNARTQKFKQELRERVSQQYITYYDDNMNSNKFAFKSLRLGILASVFFISVVALSFAITGNLPDLNNQIGAEVAYFDGDLEIELAEGVWKDVSVDYLLEEGDTFRVVGEGRAIINIDDGSSVRISSDSSVAFVSLNPNDIKIENLSGEVYTRVVRAERSFTVLSDSVEYRSLGTAYKTINNEKEHGVEVYHSKVEVKEVDSQEKVVVNAGSKLVIAEDKSKKIEEIKEVELKDDFVQWNAEQDKKDFADELGVLVKTEQKTEVKVVAETQKKEESKPVTSEQKDTTPAPTPTPTPTPTPAGSISITGVSGAQGNFTVNWSTSNLDASQGYKIIYNKTGNPAYPTDNPVYESNGSVKSRKVTGLAEGTYYVRVCRYTGSGCDTYSNQVQVNVTAKPQISSISLQYSAGKLSWSTNTGTTGEGFKIVKNEFGTPVPTYPENSISYIDGFNYTPNANGFYRICAWDGNSGCTAYSNLIEVTDK